MTIIGAVNRMRKHLRCDPLDRTDDPYREDQDQYHKDTFTIRDAYLKRFDSQVGSEETLERLRRYTRGLVESLENPHPLIIAGAITLILRAAMVYCGKDLVREIAVWIVDYCRVDHGLCQTCNNSILPPQHKAFCPECDARLEEELK